MAAYLRKFFRWVPVSWKATLDYYFDRSLGKEFGGPFNGQIKRQEIFKGLVSAFPFTAIVETGTFRGVTTAFMATESELPVFTVEYEPRFFHYATLGLKQLKNVKVFSGDSRKFIDELSHDRTVPKEGVFFYLDAHWNADLPLFDELEAIGRTWTNSVVMIDDFEVPDDAGYAFDDYGDGKKLSLEYISKLASGWSVYFPLAKSKDDTGLRRGCVVLMSKELQGIAAKVMSLRLFDSRESLQVSSTV